MNRIRRTGAFLAALALIVHTGCVGCSSEDGPTDTGGGGNTDTGAVDTGTPDAGGTDSQDEQDTDNGTSDTGAPDPDTSAADAGDTAGSQDTSGSKICSSDQYCQTLLKDELAGFQTAVCNLDTGICEKVTKAGSCGNDGDCDDGSECTTDKCDLTTNKCVATPIANCCAGKVTLLNARFEQKSLEGFSGSITPSGNYNVKWALSTNRSHTGKNALYFGNACNTYDSSMEPANGCKDGTSPKAFEANLLSQEVTLPKNKPAIAHFWLWIAAEKPFEANGNCPNGCKAGTACVKVDGSTSVCIPENDVVRVFVESGAPSPDPVWDSTSIGKSTKGWVHVAINLAPYQKKDKDTPLKLRWNFKVNNANNNFEGVYVDDVVIETLCVTDGTTCDKAGKSCADDKNPCTADVCTFFANDGSQGLCFSDKAPGCCINVGDCNDLNDCTVDKCLIDAGKTQGVCDNAPDQNNVQCCQPKNLYKDNFESGSTAAWSLVGSNSKSVNWQVSDKDGSGSAKSLFFGKATLNGYDDPTIPGKKGPKGRICSPELTIEQGTLYDVLTFDLKLQTEWSGKPAKNYKNPPCPPGVSDAECKLLAKVDDFAVHVFDAGQYKEVWSGDTVKGTTEGKWHPVVVNLDKYQGKKVKICFSFDAGDASANSVGGVWVDNVSLDVACNKTECATDTDAVCVAKCGACGAPSCNQGTCECTPIAGCCLKDADCDDADTCTNDKCELKDGKGQCSHTLTSQSCCTDKIGDKAVFAQDFEGSAKMPKGWDVKIYSGKNDLGMDYAQDKGWMISLKSKPGTGNYALYFGGKDGTINAGNTVPAGSVTGPEFAVPKNGTTVVSFDLFLATEWDDFPYKKPPIPIDQMFVQAIDVAETDPKKQVVDLWDSYAIEGTTKGKWAAVVMAIPASLAGKKVRLRFVFDCGSNQNNKGEGAFVDNLKVETLCTKPACVADSDCAPQTADPCKKFWCGKDAKGAFACQSEFKPGKGCCSDGVALPAETGEGGSFSKWAGKPFTGTVKWQIVDHKYLVGKKEIYFGNSTAWNYADGSAKVCTAATDCPAGSGEQCVGAPAKKCYKPVTGELLSDPFDPSPDAKKTLSFKFKAFLDIETNWETLEIWVSWVENPSGSNPVAKQEKVWEKSDLKDMPVADYKKVVDKSIDLSKYKAFKNVRIRLVFDSGDANGNDKYEGIFLDDMVVEEICQ